MLLSVAGDAGSLVAKGLYAHHLGAWLQHFPASQLKVLNAKTSLAGKEWMQFTEPMALLKLRLLTSAFFSKGFCLFETALFFVARAVAQVVLFEDFYASGADESVARLTQWLGVPTAAITKPLGYRAYTWCVVLRRSSNSQ